MRWVIPLLALILLVACGGSSGEAAPTPSPQPSPSPSPTLEPTTFQQEAYNLFLEFTRGAVADDPELGCDPDTWEELGDNPDLEPTERVLQELAFIDACKEAGELSEVADFSEYYAAAPPPEATTPTAEIDPARQLVYNEWLEFHRRETVSDPELVDYACDPLNWDALREEVDDEEQRVFFELALIDACHEAGELPGLESWSDYYANAPEP